MTLPVRHWAERRPVVLGAAAVMFAGVFALRELTGGFGQAVGLLYVVPVALVALELGLTAGLLCAALAVGLVGVWALTTDTGINALGMVTRATAFFAVGGVAGRFSVQMRDAQARQRLLLESGLALAHLTTTADVPSALASDAQRLLSAQGARVELGGARAQVGDGGDFRERAAIEVRGAHYGTLSIAPGRTIGPEDRVMLRTLALQAAVAEENRRLLEQERQRAVIRAELRDARSSLERRGLQLRELISREEASRDHVAHELHENAAQVLAAVLLGLGALERELGAELAGARLGELRAEIDSTLQLLRSLAVSLRPPALSLGLEAALEGIAAQSSAKGARQLRVALEDLDGLDPDVETMVYRVVEEALEVVGEPRALTVWTAPDHRELEVIVQASSVPVDAERLAPLGARLELMSGRLSVTASEVRAVIPLERAVAATSAAVPSL